MRFLLLNSIRFYWFLITKEKRRKCIFDKSCSHYVYEETKKKGFLVGIKALNFRIKNCQPGFDVFTDSSSGKKKMILKTGIVIAENQIAEGLK